MSSRHLSRHARKEAQAKVACKHDSHCPPKVTQSITVQQCEQKSEAKCSGRPYQFNPQYVYPRMITPTQVKAMLDGDTANKVVLAAVPFWPQNGVLWSQLDLSLGPTQAQTRYTKYIKYTTGSRTYNSIQFDWRSDLADITLPLRYYDLPSKAAFQQTLRDKAINRDNIIILYDDTLTPNGAIDASNYAVNRLAIRAMFVLQYYGHDNVFFLNGGDQEWFKAGFSGASTNISHLPYLGAPSLSTHFDLRDPIPTGLAPVHVPEPSPSPSGYTITTERTNYVISRDGVVQERLNPCTVVLDARPYKMYVGSQQGGLVQCAGLQKVRRLGHIKGAVNAPWASYLEIVDGIAGAKYARLKSTAALSQIMVDSKSLVENKRVVTVCNEGIHAVMAWFVIDRLLDYSNAIVYEGSTAEWADGAFIYDAGLPDGVLIPQGIERYPMLSGLEDI